jgi:hypothetical protein
MVAPAGSEAERERHILAAGVVADRRLEQLVQGEGRVFLAGEIRVARKVQLHGLARLPAAGEVGLQLVLHGSVRDVAGSCILAEDFDADRGMGLAGQCGAAVKDSCAWTSPPWTLAWNWASCDCVTSITHLPLSSWWATPTCVPPMLSPSTVRPLGTPVTSTWIRDSLPSWSAELSTMPTWKLPVLSKVTRGTLPEVSVFRSAPPVVMPPAPGSPGR